MQKFIYAVLHVFELGWALKIFKVWLSKNFQPMSNQMNRNSYIVDNAKPFHNALTKEMAGRNPRRNQGIREQENPMLVSFLYHSTLFMLLYMISISFLPTVTLRMPVHIKRGLVVRLKSITLCSGIKKKMVIQCMSRSIEIKFTVPFIVVLEKCASHVPKKVKRWHPPSWISGGGARFTVYF